MRRASPPPGADELAAAYVSCCSQLAHGFEQERLRLELHCKVPADWTLWSVDESGKCKLLARRERRAPCSDLEQRVFGAARAMIGAIVGRLSLHERCWLLHKLTCEEDTSLTLPHLQLVLDLYGAAWGLRLLCALSSTHSATVAALGGALQERAAAPELPRVQRAA